MCEVYFSEESLYTDWNTDSEQSLRKFEGLLLHIALKGGPYINTDEINICAMIFYIVEQIWAVMRAKLSIYNVYQKYWNTCYDLCYRWATKSPPP